MKLESMALHEAYTPDAPARAATAPIYQTTSYTFDDTQHGADLFDLKVEGNIYTRIMNPTNGGRYWCAGSCLGYGCDHLRYPVYRPGW